MYDLIYFIVTNKEIMKINELIKAVTKDYMPVKKAIIEARNNGHLISSELECTYFETNTTLELYKIIKSAFMEEAVKNKPMIKALIDEGKLTFHMEKAEKDNGEVVEVMVINQSMDERIDLVAEDVQQAILEKMVKAHKENIKTYDRPGYEDMLKKEQFELTVLEKFLPKEATREDIVEYIDKNYPSGIDAKAMGKVIGEVKRAFQRADGKLIAECVKSKIA
jgi:hypothetical protein